jgi:Legionella pneumophila major outer membrane protein precursor
MVRKTLVLLALTLVGGLLSAFPAAAQTPNPPANPPPPDPLPGLPRPLDQPLSLLQPAPPRPPYTCESLPGPYFQPDPLLDLPPLPPPGWVADVELGILSPHVKNKLVNTVRAGARPPDTVALPSAALDWAVMPRVELGRRLPSGYGEFVLSYRGLGTEGNELVEGPAGLAALHSRLDLNVLDADYRSWEISLGPEWDMRWTCGLRLAYVFFDSRADGPPVLGGLTEAGTSNSYVGFGPHAGLELQRHLGCPGLTLVGKADVSTLLGRLRQGFFEEAVGPDGGPVRGETRVSSSQDVPTVTALLGFGWQPPACPNTRFFLGYQYEYWWNVGRLSSTNSRGELGDQGPVLRAEIGF